MYVNPNFKTKKALKEAIVKKELVRVYSPLYGEGPFPAPKNGECSVEGPHYPKPHKWQARVMLENGKVVKVLG